MWVWLILVVVWLAVLGPTIAKKLSNRQFSSVRSFRRLLMLGGEPASYAGTSTSVPGAVIGFSAASQGASGRYYSSGGAGYDQWGSPGGHRGGASDGYAGTSGGYVGTSGGYVGAGGGYGETGGGYGYESDAPTAAFEPVRGHAPADAWHQASGTSQAGWPATTVTTSRTTAVRRRRALGGLAAATALFLLVALVSGSTVMWAIMLLTLGLTATYVAALIHFHRLAIERAQKVVALETRHHAAVALDERRHAMVGSAQGW